LRQQQQGQHQYHAEEFAHRTLKKSSF